MGFAGPSQAVSVECIDDDGRFCVLRATSAESNIRGRDDVLLSVDWQDRDYSFTPVELDAEAEDDHAVEFLLPSRLLDDGDFTLHCGVHRVPLEGPAHRPQGSTAGLTTEQALLVQHAQLVDQARRLNGLRAEVRGLRERAALAEDALEDARDRFETGLIGQRHEVQRAQSRIAEIQAALVAAEEQTATLETALAAGRGLLAREQEAREEAEGRAEQLAAEVEEAREEAEQRARSAAADLERARDEVDAAEADLAEARRAADAERSARDELESKLTWAQGQLTDEVARVAELDALARRRAQELDAAAEAHVDREAELEAELTIARAGVEHQQGLRAKAETRLADVHARVAALEDAEARVGELERRVDEGRADVAAAAAEVEAAQQALEEERATRLAAEQALEEQNVKLKESGEAFDARVDALNEQLAAAREAVAEEQALRVEADAAKQSLEEQSARLQESGDGLDAQVDALNEQLAAAREAVAEEQALRVEAEALLAHERTRADESEASDSALAAELDEMQLALDAERALRSGDGALLDEKTDRIRSLEHELAKARAANSHIAARLKAAEEALAEDEPAERRAPTVTPTMGARLIALDLAMRGTPREETARYLSDNFELNDPNSLLDEVYARA
jgi:chromosome segregation ATPase